MKQFTNIILGSLLLFATSLIVAGNPAAQESSSESLRLPEVVITGTDQSKIQRVLPKVSLSEFSLPLVMTSTHDDSDQLVKQARLIALVQPEKAVSLYRQAIALSPDESRTYYRLGDAYRASGQYDDAVRAYQQALEKMNTFIDVHYQLGILYESRLHDFPKAIDHYQRCVQLGGTDPRVRLWLRNIRRELQTAPQDDSSS